MKHSINQNSFSEKFLVSSHRRKGGEACDSTVTFFSPRVVVLSAVSHYGTLPSTKTMGNISEHTVAHSIPTSPSHGSLGLYSTFSPPRQQVAHNPHSEVSSPVLRGDVTLDNRHKTQLAKVERMVLEFDSNNNSNNNNNNNNNTLFLKSTDYTKMAIQCASQKMKKIQKVGETKRKLFKRFFI